MINNIFDHANDDFWGDLGLDEKMILMMIRFYVRHQMLGQII